METLRAFIALPIPDWLKQEIGRVQAELRSGGARIGYVQAENIHLTLKFLGDTPRSRIPAIAGKMSLAASGIGPFHLHALGGGAFPGVGKARVLWVGLGGEIHRVMSFQSSLETHLSDAGIARETRPFRVHLTVARIRHPLPPENVVAMIGRFGQVASKPFTIDEVVLYQSELHRSKAVYSRLETVGLTTT